MRTTIPKKLRFEVFKRDSFRCQYCGADAPNVLLHIDHIKPVSKGGTNEIVNLVTSCTSCNLGKSNILLDDQSAVSKARAQMQELQDRREQLDMMMAWREGLRALKGEAIAKLCRYWEKHTPGWAVNDNGKKNIDKWLSTFSIEEITQAMDIAVAQYLELDNDGQVTGESWDTGFNKIPGICIVERQSKEQPDIKDLYYIRGILRNRLQGYFDNAKAIRWLRAARSWGVTIDELREMAISVKNWSQFSTAIDELIESKKSDNEQ